MFKRLFWLILLAIFLFACGESEGGESEVEETAVSSTSVPIAEASTAASGTLYQLAQSEVRFTLDEELRGEPTTVVGRTDQVSGQVLVDLDNPKGAEISPIEIDAASLATDHDMRNRAINRFILVTGSFPTITYTPSGLSGLPDSVALGEAVTFIIDGELAITNVTLPVAFEATVTAVSDTRLEGHAATLINRNDFNLTIPNVPSVANVAAEVLLEIEFVAEAN